MEGRRERGAGIVVCMNRSSFVTRDYPGMREEGGGGRDFCAHYLSVEPIVVIGTQNTAWKFLDVLHVGCQRHCAYSVHLTT